MPVSKQTTAVSLHRLTRESQTNGATVRTSDVSNKDAVNKIAF